MELVLSGLTYDICLVYLDDILVHSRSFSEHLEQLGTVLDRLEQHTLKLKPTKCSLFQRKVTFLGLVVSEQGVACDPDKVEAVASWPRPKNIGEVRTFCGLASYYRTFVPNFAQIARPLHELTKKNAHFRWSDDSERAFEELKVRLTSAPVLASPRDEGTFVLDTNASDSALGVVLQQEQDGLLRVIAAMQVGPCRSLKNDILYISPEAFRFYLGPKKYRQHLLS